MDGDREAALDLAGPAAPPRTNGELVFEAPWESRIFGLTMALYQAGRFEWDEFRRRLIAAIARREARLSLARQDAHPGEYSYYACWSEALSELLAESGLCDPEALAAREADFAHRPAGHDHGDHSH